MSLLNIGMSGLSASQSSLATTGNNIANVDTAGYSRQQTVQGTKSSQQYGTVFIGTGTTLADVRRVYNSYLESQLHTATSLNSEAASYLAQATPLDSTLSDTNTGLTGVLQKFFTSMQGVATSATDDTSRQSVLTGAQALTSRFNALAKQLNDQNTTINGSLTDMTAQVNKLATSIANLNQKIGEISTSGGAPNDLLDQRDHLARDRIDVGVVLHPASRARCAEVASASTRPSRMTTPYSASAASVVTRPSSTSSSTASTSRCHAGNAPPPPVDQYLSVSPDWMRSTIFAGKDLLLPSPPRISVRHTGASPPPWMPQGLKTWRSRRRARLASPFSQSSSTL